MSNIKAIMHQIQFRRMESLQRSPDALDGFKRPISKGKGGEMR